MVKFRHTYDPLDMGKNEYLYNMVARECGICVPDFELLDNKYFATKRFDVENKERIHTITVSGVLECSINPPSLDYKQVLSLTGYLTQNPIEVEEMYKRMVFNVLAENKDDHAKNFSFLYKNNHWELSPAYDLTKCVEGYNGEHATSVNFNGNPTIEDLMEIRNVVRISKDNAETIIKRVKDICSSYKILSNRFSNKKIISTNIKKKNKKGLSF